jgi:hypothetical protein
LISGTFQSGEGAFQTEVFNYFFKFITKILQQVFRALPFVAAFKFLAKALDSFLEMDIGHDVEIQKSLVHLPFFQLRKV